MKKNYSLQVMQSAIIQPYKDKNRVENSAYHFFLNLHEQRYKNLNKSRLQGNMVCAFQIHNQIFEVKTNHSI